MIYLYQLICPEKFDNPEFLCYINKVKDIVPENQMAVHIPK